MPSLPIYLTASMLFLSIAPLPYGYYTLLRLVVTFVFAWAAFIGYEKEYRSLPWVFGGMAMLFNPLIQVHLPKEIWMAIDVCAGIFLLATKSRIVDTKKETE